MRAWRLLSYPAQTGPLDSANQSAIAVAVATASSARRYQLPDLRHSVRAQTLPGHRVRTNGTRATAACICRRRPCELQPVSETVVKIVRWVGARIRAVRLPPSPWRAYAHLTSREDLTAN